MGMSWKEGRRIVNLFELAQQMDCKACGALLDLRRTDREERFGMASVLRILCKCGAENDVQTERKLVGEQGQSTYVINTEVPLNMQALGMDVGHMLNFLAVFQVPVGPADEVSCILPVSAPPTVMPDGTLVTMLPTTFKDDQKKCSPSLSVAPTPERACKVSTVAQLPPLATETKTVHIISKSMSNSPCRTVKIVVKKPADSTESFPLSAAASSTKGAQCNVSVTDGEEPSKDSANDDELLRASFEPDSESSSWKKPRIINLKPSTPSSLSPEQIIRKINEDTEENTSEFQCTVCSANFHSELEAYCHITVHTGSKELTCLRCGTKFKGEIILNNIALLEAHINRHNNQGQHECKVCGKIFHGTRPLHQHMQVHGDSKNHACDQCSFRTDAAKKLRLHMKTHSDERLYVCEFCGWGFRQRQQMTQHVARVHKKERPNACSLCHKAFFSKTQLKFHNNTHTGQRDHQCEDCGKSFLTPNNLATHRRIHTGDKPYTCKVCDARFTQKNSLNWHMKKHAQEN